MGIQAPLRRGVVIKSFGRLFLAHTSFNLDRAEILSPKSRLGAMFDRSPVRQDQQDEACSRMSDLK